MKTTERTKRITRTSTGKGPVDETTSKAHSESKLLPEKDSDQAETASSSLTKPKTQTSARIGLVTRDQISNRAYHLWLKRGCEHGHHVEDWLEAEAQLNKEGVS